MNPLLHEHVYNYSFKFYILKVIYIVLITIGLMVFVGNIVFFFHIAYVFTMGSGPLEIGFLVCMFDMGFKPPVLYGGLILFFLIVVCFCFFFLPVLLS